MSRNITFRALRASSQVNQVPKIRVNEHLDRVGLLKRRPARNFEADKGKGWISRRSPFRSLGAKNIIITRHVHLHVVSNASPKRERERERSKDLGFCKKWNHTDLPKDNAANLAAKILAFVSAKLFVTEDRCTRANPFILCPSRFSEFVLSPLFFTEFSREQEQPRSLRFVTARTNTKVPKISSTLWITALISCNRGSERSSTIQWNQTELGRTGLTINDGSTWLHACYSWYKTFPFEFRFSWNFRDSCIPFFLEVRNFFHLEIPKVWKFLLSSSETHLKLTPFAFELSTILFERSLPN